MKERAALIKLGVDNGVTNLSDIQNVYNQYVEGGNLNSQKSGDSKYYAYMEKLAAKKAKDWNQNPDEVLIQMLNDKDYNYRVFYDYDRNSAEKMLTSNSDAHFSDIGKTVYHPTFSDESIYSGKISDYNPKGTIGGHWENFNDTEYYIPSESQFTNNDINLDTTKSYLRGEADISMINAPSYMLNDLENAIRNNSRFLELRTYYPIISNYPFTGHSSLLFRRLNPDFSITTKAVNKKFENNGYNLVTNNCSDATREVLEKSFKKQDNPIFFTTPGDVQDFALNQLGGIKKYKGDTYFDSSTETYVPIPSVNMKNKSMHKGKSVVYIPTNAEQRSLLDKYITEGNKSNQFTEGGPLSRYKNGGYKPSAKIKKQISTWEGSSMKTNRPFEAEALDFNRVLPEGATDILSQEQLDGLYSYSYNVGAGNFKKRVSPVLQRYLTGRASAQDVQRSMWASRDSELRGLANRRAVERGMFGNYEITGIPGISDFTTNMMINNLPTELELQMQRQEIPQEPVNLTQPVSIDTHQQMTLPMESPVEEDTPTGTPLVGVLNMLQNIRSNDYYTPNHYNIKFGDGGGMSTMDKIKLGASFLPVVGTVMDLKELYDHPSWENAGWAALSLGSDLLGASLFKGAAKTANALRRVRLIDEANRLRKINKLYKTGTIANKAVDASANAYQQKEDFKTIFK